MMAVTKSRGMASAGHVAGFVAVAALVAVSVLAHVGTVNAFAELGEDGQNVTVTKAPLRFTQGFWDGFTSSISMIIVSELGDKTFFIAAIMAMRHPKYVVFAGALGALGLMTALSAAMGFVVPALLPKVYTHYAAMCLFAFFGVRLLKEAWEMDPDDENSEFNEAVEELEEKSLGSDADDAVLDPESGARRPKSSAVAWVVSPILIQAFTITFLAEWGDRSQIATIVMGAAKNPYGVTIGGTIGHAICTLIAVVGGQILALRISVRNVSFVGGLLFVIFAVVSFQQGPESGF